jgi:hypothetical protein
MSEGKKKDAWDKLQVIASLSIPIVVAVVGGIVNATLKKSDMRAEYVRLAAEILKTSDTTQASNGIRRWAFAVLKEGSPVPIPPEVETAVLRLYIERPQYSSGGSLEDSEIRLTSFGAGPFWLYVDSTPRAVAPATVSLGAGTHAFQWRTEMGAIVCDTLLSVPAMVHLDVNCDPRSRRVQSIRVTRGR